MRKLIATLPLIALLAACGGGAGPQTISGATGGLPVAPAAPSPGQSPNGAAMPEVLKNTETTAYRTLGGNQSLTETYTPNAGAGTSRTQRSELYVAAQAPLSTVGGAQVEVVYDPRAAIFNVSIQQPDIKVATRYQDPAHRTAFGGEREPQSGVPDLAAYNYVENESRNEEVVTINTFFYQRPGTNTRYVTLGGFVRNHQVQNFTAPSVTISRVRGVEVFGNPTPASEVPKVGSATYSGNVLASMVSNTELDNDPNLRSRFEWVTGTGTVNVDFAAGKVSTDFRGTVVGGAGGPLGQAFTREVDVDWRSTLPAPFEGQPWGEISSPNTGKVFTASGSATFDRNGTAFSGSVSKSSLDGQDIDIAGSALDGTFFGPNAVETGVSFRVVGATPDTRVDITGGFTGAKPAN
jgi:hypothetical protein